MSQGKKGVPVWVWIAIAAGVMVICLPIMAALGIYGVRKYIRNAKQAEAQAALTAWGDGIVRCAERDGKLPPSSSPVPARLSDVSGKKYQSAATEWAAPAHSCAGFSMTSPQYFQYAWTLRAPVDGVLEATADLDGDGAPDTQLQMPVTCFSGRCAHGAAALLSSAAVSPPGAAPPEAGPGGVASVQVPDFGGRSIDLSSVMGRARKLANAWESEAALLGIEATVLNGRVQPEEGGSAKVTFGPSRFAAPGHAGLFVVTYDKDGIHGAEVAGKPTPELPEPMCAPEAVLLRVAEFGMQPVTLRYGLDSVQRPSWLASPVSEPGRLRIFEPQKCDARGNIVVRPRR